MGFLTWLFEDDIKEIERKVQSHADQLKGKAIETAKESASHVARGYLIGACIMVAATLLLEITHKYYFSDPVPVKTGQVSSATPTAPQTALPAESPRNGQELLPATKPSVNPSTNSQTLQEKVIAAPAPPQAKAAPRTTAPDPIPSDPISFRSLLKLYVYNPGIGTLAGLFVLIILFRTGMSDLFENTSIGTILVIGPFLLGMALIIFYLFMDFDALKPYV